jgi:xanthine/uracil/vitamin C permease (AzgA family)
VSWIRAVITGLLVVAAAFALLVVVPDQILGLTGMDRSTKVLIATTEFVVALGLLMYALRRLQQRHVL